MGWARGRRWFRWVAADAWSVASGQAFGLICSALVSAIFGVGSLWIGGFPLMPPDAPPWTVAILSFVIGLGILWIISFLFISPWRVGMKQEDEKDAALKSKATSKEAWLVANQKAALALDFAVQRLTGIRSTTHDAMAGEGWVGASPATGGMPTKQRGEEYRIRPVATTFAEELRLLNECGVDDKPLRTAAMAFNHFVSTCEAFDRHQGAKPRGGRDYMTYFDLAASDAEAHIRSAQKVYGAYFDEPPTSGASSPSPP